MYEEVYIDEIIYVKNCYFNNWSCILIIIIIITACSSKSIVPSYPYSIIYTYAGT